MKQQHASCVFEGKVDIVGTEDNRFVLHLHRIVKHLHKLLQVIVVLSRRKEARGRNRSLSAWIGGLVQDAVMTDWPQSFVDLLRQGGGELVEPDDPPPEDIEPLR